MAQAVGYLGHIEFIKGPVGFSERGSDCSRLLQILGPVDWTEFDEGVIKIVEWCHQQRETGAAI
jgi:hypothetical protein